jgi:hypothetical protein
MAGDFSEVSSQGWFSRIMDSIKGVLVGFVLFLVSFVVLGWNEYRSVKTARSLEEGGKQLVQVDPPEVKEENKDKFISFHGKATTDETLKDEVFGVTSEKTINLHRKVEMYQWKENVQEKEEKQLGGKVNKIKTYSYEKVWSEEPIDSSKFNAEKAALWGQEKLGGKERVENPPMTHKSQTFYASKVTVGAFSLPAALIKKIHKDEPLPVPEKAKGPESEEFLVKGGIFYKGASPTDPHVGDVKVSYTVTKPTEVSVYGKQFGNSLEPFPTSGDPLLDLRMGEMSGHEMIRQAESENVTFTWLLRLVGFILMVVGLSLMFKPLVVVADVVPFIGNILSAGTLIFAIIIALPLTLLTIGIAWVAVRPLVGIPLLIGGIALIVGAVFLFKRKKKPAPLADAGGRFSPRPSGGEGISPGTDYTGTQDKPKQ